MKKTWRNFIKKAKSRYQQIKPVFCPAFGELVYFDERGFNHLVMKNGRYRSKTEQVRRLKLMNNVPKIIGLCTTYNEYRKISRIFFWAFVQQKNHKRIKVVIRRISDGKLHFFSVMDKKIPKSTQAPEKGLL